MAELETFQIEVLNRAQAGGTGNVAALRGSYKKFTQFSVAYK
jgi:hypothetical protein